MVSSMHGLNSTRSSFYNSMYHLRANIAMLIVTNVVTLNILDWEKNGRVMWDVLTLITCSNSNLKAPFTEGFNQIMLYQFIYNQI